MRSTPRASSLETWKVVQGSRFTTTDCNRALATREIKISMGGRGSWRDNVFVERLCRTVKSEEVYLRACTSVCEAQAKAGITRYPSF